MRSGHESTRESHRSAREGPRPGRRVRLRFLASFYVGRLRPVGVHAGRATPNAVAPAHTLSPLQAGGCLEEPA